MVKSNASNTPSSGLTFDRVGWLCKIEMSNPAEMDELLSEEAYAEFVEES